MSTRTTRTIVVVASALLCVAAYVSAQYLLSPAVVDSGGGHAESDNYQLDASIGGPVVLTSAAASEGEAESDNFTLKVNAVSLLDSPDAAGGGGDGGGCTPGSAASSACTFLVALGTAWSAARAKHSRE